jgi:hypothetical protein
MADDRKPPLRLVSDRTKGDDFESVDRFIEQRPRDRQRGLAPWRSARSTPETAHASLWHQLRAQTPARIRDR